ncbi:hypothetical protein BT63DRAFT_471923, partial [Microthyrium microscopicum]
QPIHHFSTSTTISIITIFFPSYRVADTVCSDDQLMAMANVADQPDGVRELANALMTGSLSNSTGPRESTDVVMADASSSLTNTTTPAIIAMPLTLVHLHMALISQARDRMDRDARVKLNNNIARLQKLHIISNALNIAEVRKSNWFPSRVRLPLPDYHPQKCHAYHMVKGLPCTNAPKKSRSGIYLPVCQSHSHVKLLAGHCKYVDNGQACNKIFHWDPHHFEICPDHKVFDLSSQEACPDRFSCLPTEIRQLILSMNLPDRPITAHEKKASLRSPKNGYQYLVMPLAQKECNLFAMLLVSRQFKADVEVLLYQTAARPFEILIDSYGFRFCGNMYSFPVDIAQQDLRRAAIYSDSTMTLPYAMTQARHVNLMVKLVNYTPSLDIAWDVEFYSLLEGLRALSRAFVAQCQFTGVSISFITQHRSFRRTCSIEQLAKHQSELIDVLKFRRAIDPTYIKFQHLDLHGNMLLPFGIFVPYIATDKATKQFTENDFVLFVTLPKLHSKILRIQGSRPRYRYPLIYSPDSQEPFGPLTEYFDFRATVIKGPQKLPQIVRNYDLTGVEVAYQKFVQSMLEDIDDQVSDTRFFLGCYSQNDVWNRARQLAHSGSGVVKDIEQLELIMTLASQRQLEYEIQSVSHRGHRFRLRALARMPCLQQTTQATSSLNAQESVTSANAQGPVSFGIRDLSLPTGHFNPQFQFASSAHPKLGQISVLTERLAASGAGVSLLSVRPRGQAIPQTRTFGLANSQAQNIAGVRQAQQSGVAVRQAATHNPMLQNLALPLGAATSQVPHNGVSFQRANNGVMPQAPPFPARSANPPNANAGSPHGSASPAGTAMPQAHYYGAPFPRP